MRKRIRLTESQLHNIIRRCVNEAVNEMTPELLAAYSDGRRQQADTAKTQGEKLEYQRKADRGAQAARDAWNKQYGFSYNNGNGDWGEQTMGGANGFTHNMGSEYGVNYRGQRNRTTTNMAYNPKSDDIWYGDGRGNETVVQNDRNSELGDNGAYATARRMQNAKWSDVQKRLRKK